MPLKIVNRYFVSGPSAKAGQHVPAVDAWLKTQTANRIIAINELRAALPAIAADLTREVVNEICARLQLVIENPDDQGP